MSTLKMVAIIDGEEVTVGRCQPGQARILQKKGLAEWQKGKVVFKSPPEWVAPKGSPGPDIHMKNPDSWDLLREMDKRPSPPEPEPLSFVPRGFSEEERQEIDPEGLLNPAYHHPETVICGSARQWCEQLATRKRAGHELVHYDNPMGRTFGFADYDDDTCWEIGVAHLKGAADEEFAVLGDPREVRRRLAEYEGRRDLIGWNIYDNGKSPEEIPKEIWEVPAVPFPAPVRHSLVPVPHLRGWSTFQWPGEMDVVEIKDKEGIVVPQPEDSIGWGSFHREREAIVRLWWGTSAESKVVMDTARMAPDSMIYTLIERQTFSDLDKAIQAAKEFFLWVHTGIKLPPAR